MEILFGIVIPADFFGYAGMLVGICLMLPQIRKIWRTKKAHDLALGTVTLYILGCLCWLLYGLCLGATPIIITNGTCFIIGIVQLVLKLKY